MLEAMFSNPFRVPQWRWLRACGYLDGQQTRPTKHRDGPQGYKWIKRAAQFKRAFDECSDEVQLGRLAEDDPGIFWAHHAFQDPNSPMKNQLEAHLLARGSDWEIGYAAGLTPNIIEAYESVFFNVRERLNHQGYIVHCVIGPAVQRGVSEREYDLLWKLYGYFHGPHILQALITRFPNPGWCSTPDTVGSTVQDDAINTLKIKAALAAKTVAVNYNTQLELLNIFTKFVEVERTTDTAGKAQSQILDHIGAMMVNLPFSVNGRDPTAGEEHVDVDQGNMTRFRKAAVELSFEETMAVAAGKQLPNERMILQLGHVDADGNATAFPPVVSQSEDVGGQNA